MKQNSTFGTPYTSVRYRPNTSVVVDKTPERADEKSLRHLRQGTSIQGDTPWLVDATRAAAFKPEKVANAEGRIGVKGRG